MSGPSLEAFVAARGPALLRLAWMLTADPDAAQDLVQDALARVLPRWDRVAASGDPEPYVRQVVRSVWVDTWRRSQRRLRVVDDEVPDAGADDPAIEQAGVRLALVAALTALTPAQRTVLVLRFVEDLTEVQVAEVLRCSPSTVKSHARAGLARLRADAPELVTSNLRGPRAVSGGAQ